MNLNKVEWFVVFYVFLSNPGEILRWRQGKGGDKSTMLVRLEENPIVASPISTGLSLCC